MKIDERNKYLNKIPLGKCRSTGGRHIPQLIEYAGHEPNPLVCMMCGLNLEYEK